MSATSIVLHHRFADGGGSNPGCVGCEFRGTEAEWADHVAGLVLSGLTSEATVEAATRAVWDHFFAYGRDRRYGHKDWPPPEQHMPWWRGIAEAALTAAREAAARVEGGA